MSGDHTLKRNWSQAGYIGRVAPPQPAVGVLEVHALTRPVELSGPEWQRRNPALVELGSQSALARVQRERFPDPTVKPPSSPAGYSILENRGGVIVAVPSAINPSSPAFVQAGKACQFS